MANPSQTIIFLAQNTQLPLPAGLTVTIYPQGVPQTPGNVVATGTLNGNGAAALPLAFNTQYVAVFSGSGAPSYTYPFSLGSGQYVVGPFATVSDQQNSANGFLGIQSLSSGSQVKTLFQWGTVTLTTGSDGTGSVSVSFPEAFPNAVLACFPQIYDGASDSGFAEIAKSINENASGFTLNVGSCAANSSVTVRYFAIGF